MGGDAASEADEARKTEAYEFSWYQVLKRLASIRDADGGAEPTAAPRPNA